jgi:hypothetical protein
MTISPKITIAFATFLLLIFSSALAFAAQTDIVTTPMGQAGKTPTSDLAPVFQTATALSENGLISTRIPTRTPNPIFLTATARAGGESRAVVSLESYDADYLTALAELQEKEVIPLGGSLVYQTGYAFFDGRGTFYTPLAEYRPHLDYIIAGELNFRPSETEDIESCALLSRIQTTGQYATSFMLVGFTNEGEPFFVDTPDESSTPTIDISSDEFDLEEPHHFIIVVRDDELQVFIDGELALESDELSPREGTYGIGLNTTGFGARCEVNNLWIYELDLIWEGEEGVCGITVNQAVNLRGGPGVNFTQEGQILANEVLDVDGQILAADGYVWWRLADEKWVPSDLVRELGDCETLAPEVDFEEE